MMRRLVSICLCCALILSGCASKDTSDINTESTSVNTTEENSATTSYVANEVTPCGILQEIRCLHKKPQPQFHLNHPAACPLTVPVSG